MNQNSGNINTDIFALKARLLEQLNSARQIFKKRHLLQDSLGSEAVQEFLRLNIAQNDEQFGQILQGFKFAYTPTLDYLVFEKQIPQRSINLSSKDIDQGFEKTFDEMVNEAFKSKLLTGGINLTHIGIGCTITGLKGDVYRVGLLVSRKPVGIEALVRCQSVNPNETGIIILGKIMDATKIPALVVINRDMGNTQILLGPNRINFSPEHGEYFKVCLPDNYLGNGSNVSQLFSQGSTNLVEVFLVSSNDANVLRSYGQGQDLSQSGWPSMSENEVGLAELVTTPVDQMVHKKMTLTLAMQKKDLLQGVTTLTSNIGAGISSNSRPIQTNTNSNAGIEVKKTRAQLLKEQFVASKQGNTVNNTNVINTGNNVGSGSSLNRWNSQQPSAFNTNNQQSVGNNQQVSSNPLAKPFQRNNTFAPQNNNNNNQNSQPNVSAFNTGSNDNQQNRNFSGSNPFNNNNNSTNFQQQQSFGNNNNNNNTNTNSGVVWANNNQNSNQNNNNSGSQWNPPVSIRIGTGSNSNNNNNNNNSNQQPYSQGSGQGWNSQSTFSNNQSKPQQQQPFQLNLNPNPNNGSTNQQQTQAPTLRFNINPNLNAQQNNNNTSGNSNFNSNQMSNNQNQQQPFKLNLNGSKSSQQQQPQQQFQFNSQQNQAAQQLTFNMLSQTDQAILKAYYTEIAQFLNVEQQLLIFQLMQNDPVQFEQYYQLASIEYKKQLATMPDKATEQLKNGQQSKNNALNLGIQDFDDLTLFLLTFPENLKDRDQSRYKYVMTQLNEGVIDTNKALLKLVVKSTYPKNESFKDLYGAKQGCDLILLYKNEKFNCHQIVFSANAQYFKYIIRQNEELNRYKTTTATGAAIINGNNLDVPLKQTILIPDQIDLPSLRLLIKFFYTGKICESSSSRPSPAECINLLRTANHFRVDHLQERLIAEGIIPLMSPSNVYIYLRECLQQPIGHNMESAKFAWDVLQEYCMFYLAKHLAVILRQDSVSLLGLESETLRSVIEKSLYYLIDGEQDLEAILSFTAEAFANRDIYQVLVRSQYRFEKCSAFHFQQVPQMHDFMAMVDPKTPYQCNLITSKKASSVTSSKSSSNNVAGGATGTAGAVNQTNTKSIDQLDSQFIPRMDLETDNLTNGGAGGGIAAYDIKSWTPCTNFVRDKEGKRETNRQKEPVFQLAINLEAIQQSIKQNKVGATIISEAFDFGRRSWHLKVDIDASDSISLWLVERGPPLVGTPINPQNGSNSNIGGAQLPINFSSLLIEFELCDAAIGDHRTPIFFSFAHDSHQIIGQQGFINVAQLSNKGQLKVKLQLHEYILHSALMHYFTHNFYTLYKREFTQNKIGGGPPSLNQQSESISRNKGCLLNLPFYTVYQLLSANNLRIECEDYALSFLYHYTKRFPVELPSQAASLICDLLVTCLRFSYLSVDKILTAIKDNDSLRQSNQFIDKIKNELQVRASPISIIPIQATTSNGPDSRHQMDIPRKFYNVTKVQTMGRRKYECLKNGKSAQMNLLEEVIEWAIKTKTHHTNNNNNIIISGANGNIPNTEQTLRLKDQLYEERKKVLKLESEISDMHRQFQRAVEEYKQQNGSNPLNSKQNQPPAYLKKANNSWDEKNRLQNMGLPHQTMGQQQQYYPQRSPPHYLDQQRIKYQPLNNSYTTAGGQYPATNDNYFDDINNYKRTTTTGNNGHDATRYAEQKLRDNLRSDFSLLLDKINNSPQRPVIPYYKLKEAAAANNQKKNQECSIF